MHVRIHWYTLNSPGVTFGEQFKINYAIKDKERDDFVYTAIK